MESPRAEVANSTHNESSVKPTDLMPWGKHKGIALKDIPPDYGLWLLKQADFEARNPGLAAFFKDGSDVSQPAPAPAKAVAPPQAVSALEAELLGMSPNGFRAWWAGAYGTRLRADEITYIPHLRVAIAAWEAAANTFYPELQRLQTELLKHKPVEQF